MVRFVLGSRKSVVALIAVLSMLGAACGLEEGGGGPAATGGSLEEDFDLSDVELTVGSKEFTEQLVLGEITVLAMEAAGADVGPLVDLVGSTTVREALVSGEIDMYWEYTGTGWISHLGNTDPIPDPEEQYTAVAEADLENGIEWLEPADFDNTYGIAVSEENAEELGVDTLSSLSEVDEADMSLCAASEFLGRDDGLPGLEKAYDIKFEVSEVAAGIIYKSTEAGDPCVFGEIFTTDGRIPALGLVVLEDDKSFFPVYEPSLNVGQEVLEENEDIEGVGAALTEALDTETIQALNAQVDVDGDLPEDVAREWLEEEGFIE